MNSFTQHTATPSTYPAPYKSTGWPHPHHLNYTLMPNLYHNKMSPSRARNIEWLQRDHPPLGYPQQPRNMTAIIYIPNLLIYATIHKLSDGYTMLSDPSYSRI